MRAYSLDLRERIVAAVKNGDSIREAARRFAVSAASASRYAAQAQKQHSLLPKTAPGAKRRLQTEPLEALMRYVTEHNQVTLAELRLWLQQEHQVTVVTTTIYKALLRAGFTHKKSLWSPPNGMSKPANSGGKR